ncbi:SWIM zinc finger family protein [Ruegeria arenilitoris]|uniref:SWIM zinc finger family protein n=1 Tax=Ruegeria arenilitoris TaxID=1173585 RepID=UPI001480D7D7|nr:SWIM zinc finger family protein [Ruegeria arenilitoris]
MSAVDHVYHYAGCSSLVGQDHGRSLFLVADRIGKKEPETYLTAFAKEPDVTSRALRAVSEIVGSRFYVPPSMLARILREADPVATVGPSTVRFEGFSACCSAYIRLDIDEDALEVAHRTKGTTNVDFGPELRALLAQTKPDSRLEITIGPRAVGLAHERANVTERKVPLPVRWIKGFGEVQGHLSGMEKAFSLPPVSAQRFLRSLPRSKSDHQIWVAAAGPRVRTSTRPTPGSVPLRGGHRLRVFETLVGRAKALHVYGNPTLQSSTWVLDFGSQRLTLVLNAEPWRGFSGDGRLLSDLARDEAEISALRAQLNWQDDLDLSTLARNTGLSHDQVNTAMSHLAALGLVGFDLAQSTWFHRVLPFDMDRVEAMNPRLKAARKLVDTRAVTLEQGGAEVISDTTVHRVRFGDGAPSCTCPWYAKNKYTRGPCKHILAAEMETERLQ